MTFGELWAVALGTVLALGLFVGLFVFKNALKRSLFPGSSGSSRQDAMTHLLMFQAELEKRAEAPDGTSGGADLLHGNGSEKGGSG